ncbi:hypothetical protein H6G54_06260 [Anabaena cylindrica FACHB-243]|uniref:Uncharacterized protein n=1 Tax=Anabaena cylindrica (strain ATCC 27899 / PCC 7122) TaxID=272123 RepID=K9ZJE4_ANACC|nr:MULTISPECIES: DUF6464 family protein [Anabaena]AFZ58460.1 hypothetical protein Anacy_3044 [Anabaena cylindrica PCC 7122]MBD2417317.1 hypothetical protein [Anabaena cylindrica FACHB-243]MBY5282425.1 hypothetical protein [Anabaena sp. CCAP 1446/1C]MBY5308776.1 hypothetical protein [Anabaena sp. CCAP 1446/1C]MCM2410120.1 DUF6464 family protein [Anabaena sp. CCAP 1446/1C]
MLKTLLLITVGFLPSLLSLWVIRKTQQQTRARIRQAAINSSRMQIRQYIRPIEGVEIDSEAHCRNRYYLEGIGYLIGDISCQFNARSGYVRCAVNPSGPCQDCRHYEPRKLTDSEKQS